MTFVLKQNCLHFQPMGQGSRLFVTIVSKSIFTYPWISTESVYPYSWSNQLIYTNLTYYCNYIPSVLQYATSTTVVAVTSTASQVPYGRLETPATPATGHFPAPPPYVPMQQPPPPQQQQQQLPPQQPAYREWIITIERLVAIVVISYVCSAISQNRNLLSRFSIFRTASLWNCCTNNNYILVEPAAAAPNGQPTTNRY